MSLYTPAEINIRIVPKRLRWPEPRTGIAWGKAHDCVDAFLGLVHSVDVACAEAEQSRELSAAAIARRRAELCDQALRKLMNFAAFGSAEKAMTKEIDALERLTAPDSEQSQMYQAMTKPSQICEKA